MRRGLTLAGSLIYDHPTEFERTIELVRTGRVHPSALVTHVEGLEQAADVLPLVAAGSPARIPLIGARRARSTTSGGSAGGHVGRAALCGQRAEFQLLLMARMLVGGTARSPTR